MLPRAAYYPLSLPPHCTGSHRFFALWLLEPVADLSEIIKESERRRQRIPRDEGGHPIGHQRFCPKKVDAESSECELPVVQNMLFNHTTLGQNLY